MFAALKGTPTMLSDGGTSFGSSRDDLTKLLDKLVRWGVVSNKAPMRFVVP